MKSSLMTDVKIYWKGIFLVMIMVATVVILAFYALKVALQSKAGVENVALALNFDSPEVVQLNSDFDLILSLIAPTDKRISAIDLTIRFDQGSDLVDFLSVESYAVDRPDVPYFTQPPLLQQVRQIEGENAEKRLHLILLDQTKQSFNQYSNSIRLRLKMHAKQTGSLSFIVDTSQTRIAGSQASNDTIAFTLPNIEVSRRITIAASNITPTIGSSTETRIQVRARFQGITKPPLNVENIPVQMTFVPVSGDNIVRQVNGRIVADGVWEGVVSVPVVDRQKLYSVLLKSSRYLQKKFCDPQPQSEDGIYNCDNPSISLSTIPVSLDFSQVYILVGDIQEPVGVLDTLDIVSIRQNLGRTDPAVVSQYDLNYDNAVNVTDYALAVKALSIQNSDEE